MAGKEPTPQAQRPPVTEVAWPPVTWGEAVTHVRNLHPGLAAREAEAKAAGAFPQLYRLHVAGGGDRVI